MRKTCVIILFFFSSVALTVESPVDRWRNAIGGREKIAAVKAIYREATLEYAGYQGTLKVWHTAEGKYRKEEQVATFSTIETFDGTTGRIQQGAERPRNMVAAELEQTRSKRFSNANAMFFVFFPDRHRGTIAAEDSNTIVFKPEGGIEWRVILDPQTSLPQAMVHKEGDRTITVTYVSYETVDGIKVEKEIHRSAGDPARGAVIRFTKTVINPPIDPSLFSLRVE